MEFRILGPLEVHNERGAVALGGTKPRAVLTVLLLHANEPVSAERLALALWGEDAPRGATKNVHVHISRLRKALGDAEAVATTPAGYRLRVRPGELDAERFARGVEAGREALEAEEPERAAQLLRDALSLWRGPALADLAFEPFAQIEIARLEEQRLAALEARVDADLAAGRHDQLVEELQRLLATHPTRERLAGQLMLTLYRCGRQAEALEVYGAARKELLRDVGVEPGPDLRRLQHSILNHDPSLEPRQSATALPRELDAAAHPPLVARERELAWLATHWERAATGEGALIGVLGAPGIGKTRLAAELAGDVHRRGARVLYAAGSGSADSALCELRRARAAEGPTLLVVDDVDACSPEILAGIRELGEVVSSLPVLVLASGEDAEVLSGIGAGTLVSLNPLNVDGIRAIALSYTPRWPGADVPADYMLVASGGVPRRIHDAAGQWAGREATRRVGAVARRAAAGRAELRSAEAELAGDVVELQATRERVVADSYDRPMVCPFKGLASFDVADAQYFFGREQLVAEIVARLVGAQLLGIVGPSGSGKSSVMRAGLLPALASGVLPGSDGWKQLLIRPGEYPLRELTEAMAEVGDRERVVVAVDQFEETFTTCEDEGARSAFIAELSRVSSDRGGRCVVVLALRADFYGRCAAYPELAGPLAANHVLVRAMQGDELGRAIELPARRVGLSVDRELADALIADVTDEPGALPLLSTALLELWQRRDGHALRYSVYEQTGGVRGAVARLAEDAYGELDDDQRVIARGVLMRLAREGVAGGVERRRVSLTELEAHESGDAASVVALLTDRRLLTTSAGTVELAHEALLREWPRLCDWIEADREGLRIHRALSVAALEWENLGRDNGALYRGARLAEATEWKETHQPRLNEIEREFLTAAEAARQRDRITRRRQLAVAFGSLTVALLAISIVAFIAVVQGRRTASRELANRSQTVLAGDPALALAIGLDALKRHDTPAAQYAIRQATLADRATVVIHVQSSAIYRVALSPDGADAATAGDDGLVRIERLQDGRVLSRISGHKGPALDVSFSPDGNRVASVGLDGDVAISDLDGGRRRVVAKLGNASGRYVRSVEYSSDGRELLVAVTDGTVRLIAVAGSHSRILARHPGVRVARFDRSGRRVLSAGEDGYARLWTLDGRQTASMPHGKGVDLFDAAISPDARRVATAGSDGAVRIWSVATGHLLLKLALDLQPLYSLQFSSDGGRIVTGGADGVVRISDVRGGPVIAELKGHRDRVYDAGFMGARGVYSVGADGTVRTWAPLKTAVLPADAAGLPFAPSFSPARLVVSGYATGEVRMWNPDSGTWHKLPGYADDSGAVYSLNGAWILTWTTSFRNGAMRLYDAKRRTWSAVRVPPDPGVYVAAIDPTGRRIARVGLGKRVVIQSPDGSHQVTLGDQGQVNRLAFSNDGKHLVTASNNGTAHTWNSDTGVSEHVLTGIEGAVLWAAFSPDGQRVAAGGADGTIRIWPLDGGTPMVLYGHDGPVNTVAFDREGHRLVSGGKDGTVRVWDANNGDPLVLLHAHEGEVTGVVFSRDGQDVLSGAGDGLRVSSCEVCGTFQHVLALAKTRPRATPTAAERTRISVRSG